MPLKIGLGIFFEFATKKPCQISALLGGKTFSLLTLVFGSNKAPAGNEHPWKWKWRESSTTLLILFLEHRLDSNDEVGGTSSMGCCLAKTADVKVTAISGENSTIEITQSEVLFVVSERESDEDVTTLTVTGRDGSRDSL